MPASGSTASRRRWPALLLAVGFIGLCWWAWREHQGVTLLRTATTRLERTNRRLETELSDVRDQLTAVQKQKAALITAAASAPRANPAPANSSQTVDLTPYMEADTGYPAYRDHILQDRVRSLYGDLKALKLSPEAEQRLRQLLLNRLTAPQDAQAAAAKLGIAEGSPEMRQVVGDAMRDADAEIRTLLGKDGYAQLTAAQRELQDLGFLQNNLGTKLALAGSPLSTEQLRTVADTLNHFQRSIMAVELPPDQELALQEKIAQVLTPQQYEIFQQTRALQVQAAELQRRSLEAARKNLGRDVNAWIQRGP